MSVTQRRANLTFHFGGILDDPDGKLVAGSSELLRKLGFEDGAEVDPDEVLAFVERALGKYPWFKAHWRELT